MDYARHFEPNRRVRSYWLETDHHGRFRGSISRKKVVQSVVVISGRVSKRSTIYERKKLRGCSSGKYSTTWKRLERFREFVLERWRLLETVRITYETFVRFVGL